MLFRFTDAANHYRFVMDRAVPFRRLYQVKEGAADLLWQDSVAIDAGEEYIFTADCVGDCIAGYLDGVELFRLGQAALTTGTIGLFCSGSTAATFLEVRLGEADWIFQYRFGPDEEPLEAGTRITIHSGNGAAATSEEEGVQHRYAAGDGETDSRRLEEAATAPAARLRLVDPDGASEHDRTFVPAGEFGAVTATILRMADGTGLIVAAGGGGAFALSKGVWRLDFIYRRDNTTADPQSPILSQADDRSDETAVIDLPWEAR